MFYLWVFRALRGRAPVASLVASIGVAFFARSMLTLFAGHDQHTFSIPLVRAWNFGGIRLLPTDLYVAAVALLAMLLLFAMLHLTPIGRQMRAIADNPDLARACGIRSGRVLLALWATVGVLCALGGMMFGVKAVVSPEFGWELLIPAFAAMIVGGIGSPIGAVAGAVLLGIASELSVPFVGPSYKIAVAFVLLLLVLLLRPRGLVRQVDRRELTNDGLSRRRRHRRAHLHADDDRPQSASMAIPASSTSASSHFSPSAPIRLRC